MERTTADFPQEPLWMLAELASQLNSVLDLESLQLVLCRNVRWLFDYDRCTLAYYPAPANSHYQLLDISSPDKVLDFVPQFVPVTHGWLGRVLTEQKPYFVPDLTLPGVYPLPPNAGTGLCPRARSLMLLPLRIGESVVGCLCFSSQATDTYTVAFRNLGTILAAQIAGQVGAISIHQQTRGTLRELRQSQERLQEVSAQLAHQADHDPLTGLVNRRAFQRQLHEYVRSAQASDEHHVLCYLDLDRFKTVNDTCGHEAGDTLLRQIASLIRGCVREGDVVARLGGDEFAALLPHCTVQTSHRAIEAMQNAIRHLRFEWGDKMITVSGSIGVAEISATTATPEDVSRAADAACYAAKHGGRDQVAVHEPGDAVMQKTQPLHTTP